MNKIKAPISSGESGKAVANLQDALLFIVRKKPLRPHGMDAEQWKEALEPERRAQAFEGNTLSLLNGIQSLLGLPVSEIIDDAMADALNKVLKELGAIDASPEFVVRGRVAADGVPIPGIKVYAADMDLRATQVFDAASLVTTDETGSYEIA